jgi:hypothetical protein
MPFLKINTHFPQTQGLEHMFISINFMNFKSFMLEDGKITKLGPI